MTLNITVLTPRCIYQCADYRLTDWATQKAIDFATQKIAIVNCWRWSATVCFSGVGRTATVNVGDWLADVISSIRQDDPFQRLLDALLEADRWLSAIPPQHDRRPRESAAFTESLPQLQWCSSRARPDTLPEKSGGD